MRSASLSMCGTAATGASEIACPECGSGLYADGASDRPYDRTFYEGQLVAAVVRNFGDGRGTFKVLPIGNEAPDAYQDEDEQEEPEPAGPPATGVANTPGAPPED